MKVEFILLAAGKGTRTRQDLPKVLLPLGGEPMLFHILRELAQIDNSHINLVVGYGEEEVKDAVAKLKLPQDTLSYVSQKEQLGTGHAVACAMNKLTNSSIAVVLYGDVPFLSRKTIERVIAEITDTKDSKSTAVWLTTDLADPSGFGRIQRNTVGNPIAIVEEKDCDAHQKRIKEVNTGIMAAPAKSMQSWLKELLASKPKNKQGEYLLTDLMQLAHKKDHVIKVIKTKDKKDYLSANDMWQLAKLERMLQRKRAQELGESGVYMRDPERLDILGDLKVGDKVSLGANVLFKGKVKLGSDVIIGDNCIIEDSQIGDGTQVRDFCHIQNSKIGARCSLGPYARLRPQSQLEDEVHIGNFVETKKSVLRQGAKASHLSYIGDSEVGKNSNVGAGVITCNYDGKSKHQTIIEEGTFIGSNTSLVAPVTVGKNATIGAGSVITKDVPASSLAVTRAAQKTVRKPEEKPDKTPAKSGAQPSRTTRKEASKHLQDLHKNQ